MTQDPQQPPIAPAANVSDDDDAMAQVIQAPGNFIAGWLYPLRALGLLLKSPGLWQCAIVPILLNLALGIGGYIGLLLPAWNWINHWTLHLPTETSAWVASLPNWLQRLLFWLPSGVSVVDDVLRVGLAIALFVGLGLLLVQFGAILGAPWYGNLAEQVERSRVGQLPTPSGINLSRALEDIGRALSFQVKKLLLLVGVGVPLLLCNFVPVVGSLVASIGGISLAAILVLMDFLDPPLERRRLSFRAKLAMVFRTLPASASFSLFSLWLVSIPLLNLVTVPICIVAGTLFCCDYALPKLKR
jgi:CysZ protein